VEAAIEASTGFAPTDFIFSESSCIELEGSDPAGQGMHR
jgi:hypothetical protein